MGKKDEFSQEEADAAGRDRDRAAQEKDLGNPHAGNDDD